MTNRVRAKVYLVGAGPGDPELLTVKALRLIRDADVVVYDRLVAPNILELIPSGTQRIFVGKESGRHPVPQNAINRLLVHFAQADQAVVRLKGGDPFIFGRGSEEVEYLARHGVPFEIVPGITAAAGCAAAAGIPLTHRDTARGVRFVTGHCCEDQDLSLNWPSLADPDTTLVIYMGLANLPLIADRLIAAGLPGTTPAVAIASGTTERQRTCRTSLKALPERVRTAGLEAPVLLVIGRVVALAQQWDVAQPSDLSEIGASEERLGHG